MITQDPDLTSTVAEVLEGEPVVLAYLYGSRARGDHRTDSDVDIAVLLDRSAVTEDDLNLATRLAGRLEHALRAPVDPLLVLDTAPLRLVGRVLRDGTVLYSRDEPRRVDFESRMGPQALDYEIKATRLDRQLLQDFAAGRR